MMDQYSATGNNGDRPTSRLQVEDDENHSQTKTINRIHAYRDQLAEFQVAFAENELVGEVPERRQHRAYHQLASGLLRLLKPYLTDEEIDEAEYYWNDIDIGTFTVNPPAVIQKPDRQELSGAIRSGDQTTIARAKPRNEVEPRHYTVKGLRDFAAAQPEWEVQWNVLFGPDVSAAELRSQVDDARVQIDDRQRRTQPITVRRLVRVPKPIIDDAITYMESFLRDIGMDIEINEGLPEWGFEEVEEHEEDQTDAEAHTE